MSWRNIWGDFLPPQRSPAGTAELDLHSILILVLEGPDYESGAQRAQERFISCQICLGDTPSIWLHLHGRSEYLAARVTCLHPKKTEWKLIPAPAACCSTTNRSSMSQGQGHPSSQPLSLTGNNTSSRVKGSDSREIIQPLTDTLSC